MKILKKLPVLLFALALVAAPVFAGGGQQSAPAGGGGGGQQPLPQMLTPTARSITPKMWL